MSEWKNNICNSYVLGGLIKNPIIAAMVVTIIAMMVAYWYGVRTKDTTKIFIFATLANTCFLLFYACAMKKQISEKVGSDSLANEVAGLRDIPSTEPIFGPTE